MSISIYEQTLISCKRMKKALSDKGVKGIRKDIDKMKPSELIEFKDYLYNLVQNWEEENQEELNY